MQKYLSLKLQELIQEKQALNAYVHHHSKISNQSEQLLLDPVYQDLLSPFYQISSESLNLWLNESFEQNTNYPEQLMHKSSSGHMVRSKSEAFIDSVLYKNQIPFRYECALHMNDLTFYPDFTILHPQNHKIYYWEHFGMMDNIAYSKNAYSKLQVYSNNDIIPFVNLITTYETKEQPLNFDLVEKIVNYYFL